MATNDGHSVRGQKYDGFANAVLGEKVWVNYDTANVATGLFVARIPKGAKIIKNQFVVGTAFNAASTNVVVAGYGASLNELLGASDVTEGTAGVYNGVAGLMLTFSEDKDVYVKYTQTGTAASAGAGVYILEWVCA